MYDLSRTAIGCIFVPFSYGHDPYWDHGSACARFLKIVLHFLRATVENLLFHSSYVA
jgi:hypothetical protein